MFLAGFVGQGVLNKDPTIWLDGTIPANTCIPLSKGTCLGTQPQKYVYEY